jgi:NAD(P)-dependent dehydrogenase (short-subunit alcohol dehydrogenase family)
MTPKGLARVAGRVFVVTGAASGIGRATALLLAKRGGRVALLDRDDRGLRAVLTEVQARGGSALEAPMDVTKPDEIERARDAVLGELGAPSGVVNVAGVALVGGFLATTPDDWDHVLAVNLRGPALVTRAFVPSMIERGDGGWIVNVASAAAFITPPMLAVYGATKHGLIGLSQALREELAPHRIGVSVVCPGFVDTPIVRNARLVDGAHSEATRRDAEELLKRRGLRPERVARAIVEAIEHGAELVPVGVEAWVLHALTRVSPKAAAGLVRAAARNGDHLLRFGRRFRW